MKGGSYTNDDIQGAVTTSQDTIDALGGVMSEGENLSAESKALYARQFFHMQNQLQKLLN